MSDYRVDVDNYNGPLDLLLYLIRRDEIDIYDIPIARVARQYGQFVEILNVIDPNAAGEFLVMLATLMEVKSRALLPRVEAIDDQEDALADPRLELVRQLLAYKTFKDAAHELELAAQVQQLRYPRQPVDPPSEPGEVDLEDVSIWTLMTAFAALLEQTGKAKPTHDVVVDDTPMALHIADLTDALEHGGGSRNFEALFGGRTKAEMIGLFLALLELIRQRRIRVTQEEPFGPISIHLIETVKQSQASESDIEDGEIDTVPAAESNELEPEPEPELEPEPEQAP